MTTGGERQRGHSIFLLFLCLVLGLGLSLLSLGLSGTVRARASGDVPVLGKGPTVGLVSNAIECLAVGDALPGQARGIVTLDWQGQAEAARLILSVAGTEAAHSIKVNGQPVARVPIHPDGQPCSDEDDFYLEIPPNVLVQGENLIEITNDAAPDDSWTAAQVRLEVSG
ncbi:MAG: hypothetical protein D6759_09015, partial [Chloroflexi bacterium]